MADRLYTSSEADEILSALRFETKLEKATLARMAFALSLSKVGSEVPSSPNYSGGEIHHHQPYDPDDHPHRAGAVRFSTPVAVKTYKPT